MKGNERKRRKRINKETKGHCGNEELFFSVVCVLIYCFLTQKKSVPGTVSDNRKQTEKICGHKNINNNISLAFMEGRSVCDSCAGKQPSLAAIDVYLS